MTASVLALPDYVAGTWKVDAVHSDVSFSVRHMMVSKVRGRFTEFDATIVTADDQQASSVIATIDLTSIDTGNEQRDNHIRSADFFEVEKYPTMTYRSSGLRPNGEDWIVDGELTLHGVTRPVPSRSNSTDSRAILTVASGPDSRPPPRSTVATSASTSACRWTVAAWSSATRSRSRWRSRPCSTKPDRA